MLARSQISTHLPNVVYSAVACGSVTNASRRRRPIVQGDSIIAFALMIRRLTLSSIYRSGVNVFPTKDDIERRRSSGQGDNGGWSAVPSPIIKTSVRRVSPCYNDVLASRFVQRHASIELRVFILLFTMAVIKLSTWRYCFCWFQTGLWRRPCQGDITRSTRCYQSKQPGSEFIAVATLLHISLCWHLSAKERR